MLQGDPLRERIIHRFETMSPQLQQAARYILEHPQEVALVSMRELARKAGVQPASMTRLAKFLDLTGYEDLRSHHADTLRFKADGFAARAFRQGGEIEDMEATQISRRMLQGLAAQISRLAEPASLERLSAASDRLYRARRIYVLGLRSCHSVAWHFHYVMALLGEKTVHLDGPADTVGDGLIWATDADALLAVSINPYASHTLELAQQARDKGLDVVAITDSEVSPLASIADETILCSTESQSFFHTLAPALAVSEVLCGLLANKDRAAAMDALQRADRHLLSLNTYASAIPRRSI